MSTIFRRLWIKFLFYIGVYDSGLILVLPSKYKEKILRRFAPLPDKKPPYYIVVSCPLCADFSFKGKCIECPVTKVFKYDIVPSISPCGLWVECVLKQLSSPPVPFEMKSNCVFVRDNAGLKKFRDLLDIYIVWE